MYEDDLAEQVRNVSRPVYLETKAELVDYYRKEYPARWQRQLSEDLAPITGLNPRSIARRFNPDRVGRPGSALEQLGYQELGQEIGPVEYLPPEDGYEVTFAGLIRISNKCYPRSFATYITGDDAYNFANNPDGETPITAWFAESGQEDVPEGWCEEPQVEVRAA